MKKCREPNVFAAMLCILREKIDDHDLRIEIYSEVIEVIESAKLVSTVHFMLGEDPAFDDAHKLRTDRKEK